MTGTSQLMRVHRPAAVRALNRAASLLRKAGLFRLPLAEEALLDAARRKAGGRDFEDGSFREALRYLVDSLEREAELNFIGRMAAREDILQLLVNRLHLERDRGLYPEIAAQTIVKPLFITGLPRTGTTLLHSLLALDPGYRAPLTWEVMYPSPPTGEGERERIARTENNFAWLDRLAPDFKKTHLAGAMLPQECVAITSHAFMSDQFDTMYNVPAYRTWFEARDMRPAYDFHRRFLQHLQYRDPALRWVLKAPAHMLALDALLTVYPDAQVVQTHREPLEVIASTASLTTILRGTFSDFVDTALIGREMSEFWAETLETFARSREKYDARRFFDLDYLEFVKDPVGCIRRLYQYFGNELSVESEGRMREFLARNPKDKHGAHRYTLGEFGLDAQRESARFQRYRERYNITTPQMLAAV